MLASIATQIKTLSRACEEHDIYRHLIFVLLSIVVVCFYGYYFGTFDQVSHIPFLKKTVDPSLYPNDHYFDLRFTHYSYFWVFFIPFYKARILEILMFGTHLVATYLTFWGIWKVSYTLFRSGLASLMALLALLTPHFGFSGFPFFEFSLLNRTVALPLELFVLSWYLEKKTLRTFFALGLLFNIHVISVNFLMGMILLDILLRLREFGVRRLVQHLGVFLLGASPVLIWKLSQTGMRVPLQPSPEWYSIVDRGVFAHLFHFFSIQSPYITLLTLGGISTFVLFFLFFRRRSYHAHDHADQAVHTSIKHFVYAGMLILCVQFVTSYLAPSAFVIQLQIARVGVFVTLFCYLYGANYVSHLYDRDKPYIFLVWVVALMLSFSPLILLVVYLMRGALHRMTIAKRTIASICIVYVVALCIFYVIRLWRPGVYVSPPKNAFNDVQLWAKSSTPKDALFITPPEKFWIYDVEWRVLSERSTVATISELLEAAFDPGYIAYWKIRFDDVAPGAIAQFNRNFFDNLEFTRRAYYRLTTDDLVRLARKYRASYVVVEKPYVHDLPLVYENEAFRVYSMR